MVTKCPTCGERFVAYDHSDDTEPVVIRPRLRMTIPPPPPAPHRFAPIEHEPINAGPPIDLVVPRRPRWWRRALQLIGLGIATALVVGVTYLRLCMDAEHVKAAWQLERTNDRVATEMQELREYLQRQHAQAL